MSGASNRSGRPLRPPAPSASPVPNLDPDSEGMLGSGAMAPPRRSAPRGGLTLSEDPLPAAPSGRRAGHGPSGFVSGHDWEDPAPLDDDPVPRAGSSGNVLPPSYMPPPKTIPGFGQKPPDQHGGAPGPSTPAGSRDALAGQPAGRRGTARGGVDWYTPADDDGTPALAGVDPEQEVGRGWAKRFSHRDGAEAESAPKKQKRAEKSLLVQFIGSRASRFARTYDSVVLTKNWIGFNFGVLVFSFGWFLWRKMYTTGLILAVVSLLAVALVPPVAGLPLGPVVLLAVWTSAALIADSLYVRHALRRVNAIEDGGAPVAERNQAIERAGGTSLLGAAGGAALLAAVVGLTGYTAVTGTDLAVVEAPGCSDPRLQATVGQMVGDRAVQLDLPAELVTVFRFREMVPLGQATSPERRLCAFTVSDGTADFRLISEITWRDRDAGTYSVEVLGTEADFDGQLVSAEAAAAGVGAGDAGTLPGLGALRRDAAE